MQCIVGGKATIEEPLMEQDRDSRSDQKMGWFLLALLVLLAPAMVLVSRHEMRSAEVRAQSVAQEIARAGLREARDRLADRDELPGTLLAARGEDGIIGLDPDALRPVFDALGQPIGLIGSSDDVPLQPLTHVDGGWYVTFLTDDPAIVSLGIGPLEAFEVLREPLAVPLVNP